MNHTYSNKPWRANNETTIIIINPPLSPTLRGGGFTFFKHTWVTSKTGGTLRLKWLSEASEWCLKNFTIKLIHEVLVNCLLFIGLKVKMAGKLVLVCFISEGSFLREGLERGFTVCKMFTALVYINSIYSYCYKRKFTASNFYKKKLKHC